MTVEEFLDLLWTYVPERGAEVMNHNSTRFEVRHVGDDHHVGYIDGRPIGAADNMERIVRMLYAKWNARK